MKSKLINTRSVVIGLALLILDAGSAFAGSITLSGATGNSCLYSTFTADANGNLTAVCNTAPQAPTLTPTCTLSASPSTISAGATSILTASCSPAADSYVWTGPGTSGFTVGGNVNPTATTTYSVVGSNTSSGAGNTASTVVSISVPVQQGQWITPTSISPLEEIKRWNRAFENLNFIPNDVKSSPVGNLDYYKKIQAFSRTILSLPKTW